MSETEHPYAWKDGDGDTLRIKDGSNGRYLLADNAGVILPTDPDELAKLTTALWGEPVTVIRDSELPEVNAPQGNHTSSTPWNAGGMPFDPSIAELRYYRDAAMRNLAVARHLEDRDAEQERVKAEDARLAPWRTWIDERTEGDHVSWVAINEVARVLADAGVTPPAAP